MSTISYYTCMFLEVSIKVLLEMISVNHILLVYVFRGFVQRFIANEVCLIASTCLGMNLGLVFVVDF